MKICSIDPGITGAIAIMINDGIYYKTVIMPIPVSNEEIDSKSLFLIVKDSDLIIIEKVHAMPKQGVCSMFNFGVTYGRIKSACELTESEVIYVTPQEWKKKILAGSAKDKDAAIEYCKTRYSTIELKFKKQRKDNHNAADALCMLDYVLKFWKKL